MWRKRLKKVSSMSERGDREFLEDIREAAQRVIAYTDEMTYETFMADTKTQDAVIRNLEIIGEATKNLSMDLRDKHPGAPWSGMAGLRDKLIHHYFGVNLDIVWNIVTAELPDVASQIEAILQND